MFKMFGEEIMQEKKDGANIYIGIAEGTVDDNQEERKHRKEKQVANNTASKVFFSSNLNT